MTRLCFLLLAILPATLAQSLYRAIKENNMAMVNIVLKSGVKGGVNAPLMEGDEVGEPPLLMAVRQGKQKALKALLKAPKIDTAIVDKDGLPLMHVAAASGSMKIIIELLTTRKFDPLSVHAADGLAPLHRAVLSGSTDAVKALLNAEVPSDQPTADGRLPMDLAESLAMKEVLKKFARAVSKEEV
jgi:ankyrin repeat protein